MVIVAGQWEIGYNVPLTESYQWALPLRDFEVGTWTMNPISGIRNPEGASVDLEEYPDYDTMLEKYSHLTRVFFEPRTKHQNPDTVWLHEFEHPEDCIYVFGSAHYNPTLKFKREQDYIVTIKTVQDKGVLWSSQCALVALYDRMIKDGSNNAR